MLGKANQRLLETNELVGGIHDALLDNNNLHLADAFNDACVWIAELHLQLCKAEKAVSAGYVRTDTSDFRLPKKVRPDPVDDGDKWVKGAA